jgi:transmembrane sensor
MSDGTPPTCEDRVPPQAIAEASVWMARIRGPNSESAKKGLRQWLAESKTHQRAFELTSEVWDEAGGLRGHAVAELFRSKQPSNKVACARAAFASAATAALVIVGFAVYINRAEVTTGVGEQRLLTLDDGSRVLLNTSTRLVVNYDKFSRRVQLKSGEALFDVMKNPQRPFVVTAGGREVTALGTSFDVRRDGARVIVTLLEGQVAVAEVADAGDGPASAQAEVEVLHPGQRLTFAAGHAPRFDRPQMQKVTDWQRGQVSLDNLSLADAVAEMNRYSKIQLRIELPQAAAVRVSGIFRAGDSMSFARAVSHNYGLTLIEQSNAILLAGAPGRQPGAGVAADPTNPD